MRNCLAGFILFLLAVGILPAVFPGCLVSADQITNDSGTLGSDGGFVDILFLLLKEAGVDFSYGEDGGTIFSMVDTSMTRIITDLSSGSTEGFTSIPLINETLAYLHIAPADFIVDPEDVQGSIPAIRSYDSRYGNRSVSI